VVTRDWHQHAEIAWRNVMAAGASENGIAQAHRGSWWQSSALRYQRRSIIISALWR